MPCLPPLTIYSTTLPRQRTLSKARRICLLTSAANSVGRNSSSFYATLVGRVGCLSVVMASSTSRPVMVTCLSSFSRFDHVPACSLVPEGNFGLANVSLLYSQDHPGQAIMLHFQWRWPSQLTRTSCKRIVNGALSYASLTVRHIHFLPFFFLDVACTEALVRAAHGHSMQESSVLHCMSSSSIHIICFRSCSLLPCTVPYKKVSYRLPVP